MLQLRAQNMSPPNTFWNANWKKSPKLFLVVHIRSHAACMDRLRMYVKLKEDCRLVHVIEIEWNKWIRWIYNDGRFVETNMLRHEPDLQCRYLCQLHAHKAYQHCFYAVKVRIAVRLWMGQWTRLRRSSSISSTIGIWLQILLPYAQINAQSIWLWPPHRCIVCFHEFSSSHLQ